MSSITIPPNNRGTNKVPNKISLKERLLKLPDKILDFSENKPKTFVATLVLLCGGVVSGAYFGGCNLAGVSEDLTNPANPANPASPLSPANPANPASPLFGK